MSTRPFKRRPQPGVESAGQPPDELVDRLADLLPEDALEDAVRVRAVTEHGPGVVA